jgi:outer membrane protein TolC
MMKTIGILLALGVMAWGQDAISLKDAVRLALDKNKSIAASGAAEQAAESRIAEARAGLLPKVNYAESWARSDNPVFVFSSLLTQHEFGEQNFFIGQLNRPGFLNNFQSTLTADQMLFDGGQARHAIRSAELTKAIASETHRLTQTEVIAGAVQAYQAMRSAEADLQKAQAIRSAGMSTEVDVLSIRVHLAGVEEQRIRRSADVEVARAALNDVMGLALDTLHALTSRLTRAAAPESSLADYEGSGVSDRAEARQAKLGIRLAQTQSAEARSSLLPQVILHGAFEADRQRFYDRGGANWLVSAGLRWNLFNGFSDKARIDESKSLLRRSEAAEERAASGIRLQVRRAWADLRAAEQRIEVAKAAVAEGEESLRITQNRYEAGISNVTDLLRTETAVLDARTRYLAAIHDQRIAATMLEMAAGRLTVDSEVLN